MRSPSLYLSGIVIVNLPSESAIVSLFSLLFHVPILFVDSRLARFT